MEPEIIAFWAFWGNKNATHKMDGKSQDAKQTIYIVLKVHLQM